MGKRPDNMERWGAVGILKEAARLLHKHFRLFLPFFLAFQLPSSFLSAFQIVFLDVSGPSLPYTSFLTPTQGSEMDTNNQPPVMLSLSFSLLIFVFSILAVAAFAYIVAYIYSNAAGTESDDDAITKKVFKLLPHALLRIFVTQLWTVLAMILLIIAFAIIAGVLYAIVSVISGGSSGPGSAIILLIVVLWVVACFALTIMFALAEIVAVLEPEKYGRAALKQSSKYAKGRPGTIVCILIFSMIIMLLILASAQALAQAALSDLWVEILVSLFLNILLSGVSTYLATASVVMYFVCKSNFDPVLPEVQRGSNVPLAENPYEPLVLGSTKLNSIGEP